MSKQNIQTNKPPYVLPKLGATKTWTFFQYCKNSHKAAAINIAQRDTEAAPNDISRTTADRELIRNTPYHHFHLPVTQNNPRSPNHI